MRTINVIILLLLLISLGGKIKAQPTQNPDYTHYHQQIVEAEALIAAKKYKNALQTYEELFNSYEFVFMRDYKIATQLALFLNEEQKAYQLLIKGIESGWTLKSIRKNDFLEELRNGKNWKSIKKQYHQLHKEYQSTLKLDIQKKVKKMFVKDQWKAVGALFTFSSKAQDRYAEKKFSQHSEKQLKKFIKLFEVYGYPGERLIGNDFWMSTISSHHNSISTEYNRKDTLYPNIRPQLWEALKKGQISAFELVLIEEWSRASKDNPSQPTYGILEGPLQKDLAATNQRRKSMYLRPIEVHNQLVTIEQETGMNFYLGGHPWEAGKIEIR